MDNSIKYNVASQVHCELFNIITLIQNLKNYELEWGIKLGEEQSRVTSYDKCITLLDSIKQKLQNDYSLQGHYYANSTNAS